MYVEGKINVLVVDDSALMRRMITDILDNHPRINVTATAANGHLALEKIEKMEVDVVTLDIEMPGMNGIETLKEIRRIKPIPVIMFSSLTKTGAEITLQALELGAFDFIQKPDLSKGYSIESIKEQLITKILLAVECKQQNRRLVEKHQVADIPKTARKTDNLKTVIIGSSTGGPQALKEVVPHLPKDLPAQFLIVQHMPPKFTDLLAQRLDGLSQINVREAKEGDTLEKNLALLAPGNYHMCVEERGTIRLNQEPPLWGVRPAIDLTLSSAAKIYKQDLICVILTGMGHDGTQGAKVVKSFGGHCIAEDKSTCVIYGMPKSVIDAGYADEIVPLHKVADAIVDMIFK